MHEYFAIIFEIFRKSPGRPTSYLTNKKRTHVGLFFVPLNRQFYSLLKECARYLVPSGGGVDGGHGDLR
jgi:hypothetical protein